MGMSSSETPAVVSPASSTAPAPIRIGFENTYAIAVRRATADSLGLRTLSDLARAARRLRAGLTPDFIGRADGLPGLSRAYGMHFREVRPLVPAVK